MAPDTVMVEDVLERRDLGLGDVLELRKIALRSDADRTALTNLDRDFDKVVAPKLPKETHSFRKAWCAWALRRTDEAKQALSRFRQNGLASFILGRIAEESGDMPEAVAQYKEAMSELKTEADAAIAHASALRQNGQFDKASSELDKIEKKFGEEPKAAAEVAYHRGWLAEDGGDTEGALDMYEKALDIMPNHSDAAFRTGSIYDLRGKDDKAEEFYGRCAEGGVCHTGAMVNLALLLEDKGEYERAIACYRDVLRAEPDNRRARLFMSGAVESTEEVYDEIERKEREKLDQILRTPVSEFELSVRSRNVLSRMNIRTLGDLVQRTESEMLAYRNFGETSLREIKQLLTAKGLRLGLGRNEVERRQKRERLALVMSDKDSRVLSMGVAELNLSVRSRRCMARLNIQTVGDLITRSAEELTATKNFGQTSLTEIREKLAQVGLSLRSSKEPPPPVEDDTEELASE